VVNVHELQYVERELFSDDPHHLRHVFYVDEEVPHQLNHHQTSFDCATSNDFWMSWVDDYDSHLTHHSLNTLFPPPQLAWV
jgi:hypothetical protein